MPDVAPSSLITLNEAEEVVHERTGPMAVLRTPLLVVVGLGIVGAFTLLVMIIMALQGAKTGIDVIFPFLDKKPVETLQAPVGSSTVEP